MLPVENIMGLLGSLCLLVAPARDQYLRRKKWKSDRKKVKGGTQARWWASVSQGYDSQRNGWNFWDSAFTAVGALLLALSYLITTG